MEGKINYGCLMIKPKIKNWDNILNKINEDDLFKINDEFGKEDDAHITVLYGFHDNIDIDKLKELLKGKEVSLKLTNLDLFENEKFDVLKINVQSDDLNKLNKLMKDNFEYTNSYPNYNPHMTIAYLKKGCGKKYLKNIKPLVIKKIKKFYFSDKNENLTII